MPMQVDLLEAANALPFTILVVDDQPENIYLLSQLLRESYQVLAATSGANAVAIAARTPHLDLVILDIMMPEMDGYQTLERLREVPHMHDVPIIFATALHDEEEEERGLRLGAADFLQKPLRLGIVKARIHTQLEALVARRMMRNRAGELERQVRHRLHDFLHAQSVALQALASLAETRDNETGNHILRTQAYIHILCRELQNHPRFAQALTPDRCRQIVKAAPLHDIGKVGIPDSILLKPGRLTEAEFEVMKTHSLLGSEALARALKTTHKSLSNIEGDGDGDYSLPHLEFFEAAIDIAAHHHERWDGTGYPAGLQGDAIPVAARLMALADVFDALISRRVYKEPWPLDKVLQTLSEGDGQHFDPDVYAAFARTAPEWAAIAARYKDEA